MGTTLTGTTPQDTYDSLIKVTDNGPLSGTAKYLSDGLGNDSVLALSTSRVGIGTTSPSVALDVSGDIQLSSDLYMGNNRFVRFVRNSGGASIQTLGIPTGTDDVRLLTTGDFNVVTGGLSSLLTVKASGNVGIGTSSPSGKLNVYSTDDVQYIASTFAGDITISRVNTSGNNQVVGLSFVTTGDQGNTTGAAAISAEQKGLLSSADLVFQTRSNGTRGERVRILAAGGITFNGDTAAANALDDYEEGTWTPVYAGGITGATYSNTAGKYTKIGRVVHWSCRIQATAGIPTATALTIGGFPFTNSATEETAGSIGFFSVYTTQSVYMYNEPNTTNIAVFYNIDATPLLGTELNSVTGTIHCSGTYFV